MSIKYTQDGKKVMVVDTLNNEESIVCEVFVTDSGSETLGGDRFVTKNLFDEPVQSWKDKELERKETRIINAKNEIDKLDSEIKSLETTKQTHSLMVQANLNLLKQTADLCDDDLRFISDALTGNIKWIVYDNGYNICDLYIDKVGDRDTYSSGIKLISFFGYDDQNTRNRGKFRFKINKYCDGSGGDRDCTFFRTDEELHQYLLDKVENRHQNETLTLTDIKKYSEYIAVPEAIITETKDRLLDKHSERTMNNIKRDTENAANTTNSILEQFEELMSL